MRKKHMRLRCPVRRTLERYGHETALIRISWSFAAALVYRNMLLAGFSGWLEFAGWTAGTHEQPRLNSEPDD